MRTRPSQAVVHLHPRPSNDLLRHTQSQTLATSNDSSSSHAQRPPQQQWQPYRDDAALQRFPPQSKVSSHIRYLDGKLASVLRELSFCISHSADSANDPLPSLASSSSQEFTLFWVGVAQLAGAQQETRHTLIQCEDTARAITDMLKIALSDPATAFHSTDQQKSAAAADVTAGKRARGSNARSRSSSLTEPTQRNSQNLTTALQEVTLCRAMDG